MFDHYYPIGGIESFSLIGTHDIITAALPSMGNLALFAKIIPPPPVFGKILHMKA